MTEIKLPPRLAAIARRVPPGSCLADVGTDHGLLPVSLLRCGLIRAAIATDIHVAPLERARRTAAEFREERIRFVLCDGLDGVGPGEAEAVVIAGMGGENIADILRRAPWVCRNVQLLLQPMSRDDVLRRALRDMNIAVTEEVLVQDAGRIYPILAARGGSVQAYTAAEYHIGKWELVRELPLLPAALEEQLSRLRKAEAGLLRSRREEDRCRLAAVQEALTGLEEMRRILHGMRA